MVVPDGKYPAKQHAKQTVKQIEELGGTADGVIYLEGQKLEMLEDSDEPINFRQRRYFYYLTGCEVPDCYFTYDIKREVSTLFIPNVDPDDVMWSGLPMSKEEALKKYDVDAVQYTSDINPFLASSELSKNKTIYAISPQISPHITFLNFASTNLDLLKPAIEESRIIKSDYEIALIRHANTVSTAAHIALLSAAKTVTTEQELLSIFIKESIARGCTQQSYPPIVASGTSCATLHYQKNDAALSGSLNLLIDAGAEHSCYASDITRCAPISGTFTPESLAIYTLVLQMQRETLAMIKADVHWDDVHAAAHRVAVRGLLKLGLFKNGSEDEIFAARTSCAFFPHGLGHYLGMDTHDTGGSPNFADKDPMFRYLRLRRKIPERSVVTVEPGVYFCRYIVEPYLEDEKHKKFIDGEVLKRYWAVGGVRIEDDVVVTKDGYENLTDTPKEVDEVLKIVNGGER